jgi:CBS domain-containing protein
VPTPSTGSIEEVPVKIKDLKPRMPVTITKSESLDAAAELLADEDIGALVVYEPQGLTGIVSERDIVRVVADGCDLAETEVCPIAKMNGSGIRHVVVTSDGDVSGMISIRDVVALLGTGWPEL